MARPSTGSVYFQGNRWKVRVTLPDGTRKSIPLPEGYSEEDARSKAREMADAIRTRGVDFVSAVPIPKSETVEEYGVRYVAWLENRGLTSVPDVQGHLRNHIVPFIGDIEIRAVKRSDVERVRDALDLKIAAGSWIDGRGRRRRFQWKTAANVWGTVKAIFDQAANAKPAGGLRVRSDDPTDRVLPPERGESKDKQYLYPVEFNRLVACDRIPLAWRRLYALSFYLGMRAGELEALTWGAVDFLSGRVKVRHAMDRHRDTVKRPKTAAGRRPIPIEPTLLPLLLALRQEAKDNEGNVDPNARVLTWMPASSKLSSSTRKHLEWAGVERAELFAGDDVSLPMRFHDARATFVSWQAIRGDDAKKIQRRAGHSDGATTDRYIREVDGVRNVGVPFGPLPTALLAGFRLVVSAHRSPNAYEISERETGLEPDLEHRGTEFWAANAIEPWWSDVESEGFGVRFGAVVAEHLSTRDWGAE